MSDLFNRPVIDRFTDDYGFLSNFFPKPFWYRGYLWATSEHAYQAMKCLYDDEFRLFLDPKLTAGQAKRLGRKITMQPDWESVRLTVMEEVLVAKFSDPALAELILKTGDAILIEGNNWGDTFWGQVDGEGDNFLGLILMNVRLNIAKERFNGR